MSREELVPIVAYRADTIRQVIALLNEMGVVGIANANRLAVVANLLNHPEEEKDGEVQKP